jgi:hypothetical protein
MACLWSWEATDGLQKVSRELMTSGKAWAGVVKGAATARDRNTKARKMVKIVVRMMISSTIKVVLIGQPALGLAR